MRNVDFDVDPSSPDSTVTFGRTHPKPEVRPRKRTPSEGLVVDQRVGTPVLPEVPSRVLLSRERRGETSTLGAVDEDHLRSDPDWTVRWDVYRSIQTVRVSLRGLNRTTRTQTSSDGRNDLIRRPTSNELESPRVK